MTHHWAHEVDAAVTRAVVALDRGEWDDFVGAFTADATLRMADTFVGTEGLRTFTGLVAEHDPGWPRSQHFLTNVLVELDDAPSAEPQFASYAAYVVRIHRLPSHQRSNSTVLWSGELTARLGRAEDGRWRIHELRLRPWEPLDESVRP